MSALPNPITEASADAARIVDGHGRVISYLRVSVTDRCNLRCVYCGGQTVPFVPHENVLRYEEIAELIGLARGLGVEKVRLTGGEPFARKGFASFVEALLHRFPGLDLRITTNGTLAAAALPRLASAGLSRINVSLDSLDAARFAELTGVDALSRVMDTIETGIGLGMQVKVNAVAMRGVNDAELPAFVELARERPVEVRFIEYMPVGAVSGWGEEKVFSAEEILGAVSELAELDPVAGAEADGGPARVFTIRGGAGRLGVISPLSNHFCGSCNRLRITSWGGLRTCLFSDREYRLRPLLRHPRLGPKAVLKVLRLAAARKPVGHEILAARRAGGPVCATRMSSIGG